MTDDRPSPTGLGAVLARPVSVSIAALGLVVLGLFSLWRLPVSLLPTLERPSLRIHAVDADRSRSELLTQVVLPLERRLLSLDGVLDVGVRLDDGDVLFDLETEWQTDIDRLRIDVERRLTGSAVGSLDTLSVEVDAGDAQPILSIAVTGGDPARRTAYAEKVLLPELARVPGAGRLVLTGGADRRPVVTPRSADLAAHGLVAADLADRLDRVGRDRPLGRLRAGGTIRPFFLRDDVTSLDALAALSVNDAGLRLREVADVELRTVPRAGVARLNGADAVIIEVHRAPGRNAVRLAREARAAAAALAARSATFRLETVGDSSAEVIDSLLQLAQAGLIGLVLGTLVLRFLLGSWRPTLALVVVVPVSIVAAFSAFLAAGVSLDLVSLAGLALAAGMLVDNSIVVLEAIQGARERGADDPVLDGTRQIAMALVASFATTAVVFLPLIYLRGLARAFFGVQAFAIVSTLLISLMLSLSLTPVLARRFGDRSESGRLESRRKVSAGGGRQPGRGGYLKVLGAILDRPKLTTSLTLLTLMAVAAATPLMPRELVPRSAAADLTAEIRLPAGLEPQTATERLRELDAALEPHFELESGAATWRVLLREKESSRADVGDRGPADLEDTARLEAEFPDPAALDRALPALQAAPVPGLDVRFERRKSAVAAAIERTARALEVEVSASTPERLAELEGRVRSALRAGGWRLSTATAERRPAWSLRFDDARLARLGADAEPLRRQLRSGLEPRALGRTRIGDAEPDILWNVGGALAGGQESPQIPVSVGDRIVPLGAIAELRAQALAPPVERRAGRPTARLLIEGGPEDGGLSDGRPGDGDALERHLRDAFGAKAADWEIRLAGLTHELRRSFSQLRLALGLALLLVFLTVAALYESLRLPLVVMTTVPTAAAGAVLALLATGESFNVMSFLGLIVLTGLVVNNALVLLHRAEQHRTGGAPVRRAIANAAGERYRPILMTTLTTLLSMVPLALLGGEGVELRRSLAVAVSGGLVTSWLASLVVVPAFYQLLFGDADGDA